MAQPAKELVSGTLTGKEGPTDLPTDRPTDSCKLSSELRMLTEHSQPSLTNKEQSFQRVKVPWGWGLRWQC